MGASRRFPAARLPAASLTPLRPHLRLACLASALLACLASPAAEPPPPAWKLPPAIAEALARAHVPPDAFALWVQPVDAAAPSWGVNADVGMNPASVFKLVTTSAALDVLGPAWSWKTPVWFTGAVDRRGVLHGSVAIRGSGDPSLVLERTWLLLRQVRGAGVREIRGDIVLDHGLFAPPARAPGDFDGAPSEPYNVLPDALLLNYKAVTLRFTPDADARVARVAVEPPLAGVQAGATVPLRHGACGDWREQLRLAPDDPGRWHFAGGYPAACGERAWPLAYADPASYDRRLVEALWRELGGKLAGRVRDGAAPTDAPPAFEFASPPLASVIRDINKFSNNVMAEQVFLTLGAQARAASAPAGAASAPGAAAGVDEAESRAALARWLQARLGAAADGVVVANGSGLARETRISARALGALLQWDWRSPAMPELASSLPLNGVDGTLRHAGSTPGRAHLKTGSMRDVAAIAGYVLADGGRRYVLVAIVNDPNAAAARPALDAAVDWVIHDPANPAPAAGPAAP
jgi:D-alanyl-D-alanine carboxypeptidase/D-alanyl-D-alanine-endopeptidase (penicillin-binding protein 4)